jgi:anaerobic magnesium-protoporphyrin IX monomethyl ester cyclase
VKKEVKCILLSPNFSYVKGSIYREVSNLDPPLGLVSLSSYLITQGIETMVFDLNVEIKSNAEIAGFAGRLKEKYHFDKPIFGISFLTPYVNSSYELAEKIKTEFPDSLIIAGGAHATFMTDEVLSSENIDLVVRGEGEETITEILKNNAYNSIAGLSYKSFEEGVVKIIHNPDRERIADINRLPMPAYHQLKMNKYKPILGSYRKLPAANIITSRGCNGQCNFCCKPFGKKITLKTPENIVGEIRFLIENYKVRHINIYDDVFTIKRIRVMEFCDLIISQKIKIEWTCFARIDTMDKELLQKMKAAGCYQVMYGVENFEQKILDSISKNISVSKVLEIIQLTKEAGIITRISMMIGNPQDTWETFNHNLNTIKKIKPDIIVASIFTPIPGSELYKWALENNRLLTRDWSKFAGNNSVMKLDYLSQADVVKQYHKIFSDYYFTIPYLFKRLRRLNSFTQLWMSIKAFFYILKFVVQR